MSKSDTVFYFIIRVFHESKKDNLLSLAGNLTYKLILALFPFLIFAISIIGFLNLDGNYLLNEVHGVIPEEIYNIVAVFVDEVINRKSPGLLSFSLIVSIVSASSGFNAIIEGINRVYGHRDTRNFVKQRLVSLMLTFIFTLILVCIIVIFIFRDTLINFLFAYLDRNILKVIFGFSGYLFAVFILIASIVIIYKFSNSEKVTLEEIMPGSIATLITWIIAGKIFNIYINNFSKFSRVYGSIASIFILMFWLNIMSAALLIGCEINAVLKNYSKESHISE